MKAKFLISFLIAFAFTFEGLSAQTPDTLTVVQYADGVGTFYAKTKLNGNYRLGVQNPFGLTTPTVVLDTVGADTIDFYVGSTRVKRYATAKFIAKETSCTTCSTVQDIVNYWNWYKLQSPVNKILIPNLTSVERDSFYNWGPPAVGTRIFNTTIDSPQIRVSGTIKWRNH